MAVQTLHSTAGGTPQWDFHIFSETRALGLGARCLIHDCPSIVKGSSNGITRPANSGIKFERGHKGVKIDQEGSIGFRTLPTSALMLNL